MLVKLGFLLLVSVLITCSEGAESGQRSLVFQCSKDCDAVEVADSADLSNPIFTNKCTQGIYCDPSTKACNSRVNKCGSSTNEKEKFCTDTPKGAVPDVSNCRRYMYCEAEKVTPLECPAGNVFDSKSSICKTGVPCVTTRCTNSKDKPIYLTPFLRDPRFYVLCSDGEVKMIRQCEKGFQFDEATGSCNLECKGESTLVPATGNNCHRYVECTKIANRDEYRRVVKECPLGSSFPPAPSDEIPATCQPDTKCNHITGRIDVKE